MTAHTYKKEERIVKGFANHWRMRIVALLQEHPEVSVAEITEALDGEFKNISAHVSKLGNAGLIMKRNEGSVVRHKLTLRGQAASRYIKSLSD